MPDALDAAVQALTAEGVEPDVARRAAVAALWMETGHLPGPALEADLDLLPRAREFVALAEAQEVAHLQASGAVEDLATFAEGDAPEAGSSPRVLREAHLLHPGTFNGHSFTRADLAEVVANFDPQDPPPIQLDHSSSARDTQGYVRAVRLSGDSLRALLEFRGSEAAAKVADGLWRKLSAGIYLKPKRRLKEVSVTPFPAVSGPEPARVLTERSADMPEETAADTPAETTPENPPEVQPETPEAPASEPAPAAEPEPEEKPEAPAPDASLAQARDSEKEAILAEHQATIARLEAELARQADLVRLKEDTALVAEFVSTGRTAPAASKAELDFVRALSGEQRAAYVALKQSTPPLVTLGRQSMPSASKDGRKTEAEASSEAEEMLAQAGYKKGKDGRWKR